MVIVLRILFLHLTEKKMKDYTGSLSIFFTLHDSPKLCGKGEGRLLLLSFYLMPVPIGSLGRWTLGIPVIMLHDLGKSAGHIMGQLRL